MKQGSDKKKICRIFGDIPPQELISNILADPDFCDLDQVMIIGAKKDGGSFCYSTTHDLPFLAVTGVIVQDLAAQSLKGNIE